MSDRPKAKPTNVVICGLARTGLTATAHLLSAGGLMVAGEWPGFEPYQLGMTPWGFINGQAVKLVDSQHHLPPPGTYAVIRLRRDLKQTAASFNKFATHLFGCPPAPVPDLVRSFQRDLRRIDRWVEQQAHVKVVDFHRLMEQPKSVANELAAFLRMDLDLVAAAAAIIKRTSEVHEDVLEAAMVAADAKAAAPAAGSLIWKGF